MGKAELPLHAPGTKVDRGYIGESVPRPNAARLLQGRGAFTDDLRFPRLAHVVFFRSPYAHALIKKLNLEPARRQPGVIGVFDGRAVAEYCTPWVAVLAHLKGIKSPRAARHRDRACVLAGRGGGGGGGRVARAGRGRGAADRGGMGRAAGRRRHGRVFKEHKNHPSRLRGQHLLQARARHRRRRRRFREGRCGGRGHLPLRPPHRRLPRRPRHPRRLQRRRAFADRVPRHPGAAHDAGHLLAAPQYPRRQCARDREGRRRLLRHQGARLRRRDGDGGALRHAAPAGEVRRRSARVLSLRHPRARASRKGARCMYQGRGDTRLRAG